MTDSEARIWAYIHDELDAGGRRLLERDVSLDERLSGRLSEARGLDRRIRSALAAFESEESVQERLAEQALAAWERDQAGVAASGNCVPSVAFPMRATWQMLFRRPAYGLAGLAAAAAIMMLVAPLAWDRAPRGAVWSEPVFRPLVYRGTEPSADAVSRVDADMAFRAQNALREALGRVCGERGAALPPGVIFALSMHELRNGAFSVTVQARWRDGRIAGEWAGDYSGWEAYVNNLEVSAARIAENLAVCAAHAMRQEGSLYEHP